MTTMYLQKVAPKLMLEGLRDRPESRFWPAGSATKWSRSERGDEEGGIVTYHDVDSCLDAARALAVVGRHRMRLAKALRYAEPPREARKHALAIMKRCERRLDEASSKAILSLYGFSIPRGKVVGTFDEAREIANQLGFPVVVKGMSPELIHKTEAGVIHTGIGNEKDLEEALTGSAGSSPQRQIHGAFS